MSPFSQERVQWIEERLFCLARMVHEHTREGMKRAQHYSSQNYQEAHGVYSAALVAIHVERLQLMSEREVINEYNKDNPNGS